MDWWPCCRAANHQFQGSALRPSPHPWVHRAPPDRRGDREDALMDSSAAGALRPNRSQQQWKAAIRLK